MSAPPTTPIARRFLLPKRPPASSQTPAPQASQQFQSTPRFGSSSASRPTPRKAHEVEDVVDDGDDSSDGGADPRKGGRVLDTIEIESDALTPRGTATATATAIAISQTPSDGGHVSGTESPRSSPEKRDAKRRRLSISPAGSSSPAAAAAAAAGGNTPSCTSAGVSEYHSDDEEATRPQEPVFRAAPRFKVSENDYAAHLQGLPDAFSPRRKGARYLPGGMAAQLQSWLSEVKGWEGTRDESAARRVTVEEVSPGGRMYLVRGREAGLADGDEDSRAYLLAGEGELTGLGRRADVGVGGVVVIEEPVWEVTLLGEVWTVGCNWSVES